jgi:sortase (surface protein transpeptidase)
MKRSFSTFLIVLGISFLGTSAYLTWQRTNTGRLAFASYQGAKVSSQSDRIPVELSIADLNIYLPIKQATISDGKWEASHDAISYLISSPIPGEKGNSILYGHN